MDLDEIKVESSSNLRQEKTPVGGASSVPQDESRGLNEMTPEDLEQVYEYAREDKWKEAEPIFNKYDEMVGTPLNSEQDTALHVAVKANHIGFVKGLVNLMTPQQLEIRNFLGYTAFYLAAKAGNSDFVQIMIQKNQNLAFIKPNSGVLLPVHQAAYYRYHKIVQDLCSKTLLQKMDNTEDIQKLFFMTIEYDMFDVATKVFEEYPALLAIAKYRRDQDYRRQTALEMLLRKPSKELRESLQLLQKIWHQLITQLEWKGILELIGTSSLVSAMDDALKPGDPVAVAWFSENRVLSLLINSNEQNIMHYAVGQRHSGFVSYLFQTWLPHDDKDILLAVDNDGNNMLHYAAYPLKIEENSSSLTATTKMKREVAWFEGVQEKALPELRTMRNKDGKTPKDIFHDEHKKISQEVKETAKGIADSGIVAAALVATVAFAAAVTVPGDKTSPWFIVFILANAAALFTSSASILSFLSNFTSSRFADSEFVIALHPSLILGPILLLISIVTMIISFAAASFLIFEHTSKWVAYVVASTGVLPILLVILFQFRIFDKCLWSRFYRMSNA